VGADAEGEASCSFPYSALACWDLTTRRITVVDARLRRNLCRPVVSIPAGDIEHSVTRRRLVEETLITVLILHRPCAPG
jgi:hypothetical protein